MQNLEGKRELFCNAWSGWGKSNGFDVKICSPALLIEEVRLNYQNMLSVLKNKSFTAWLGNSCWAQSIGQRLHLFCKGENTVLRCLPLTQRNLNRKVRTLLSLSLSSPAIYLIFALFLAPILCITFFYQGPPQLYLLLDIGQISGGVFDPFLLGIYFGGIFLAERRTWLRGLSFTPSSL